MNCLSGVAADLLAGIAGLVGGLIWAIIDFLQTYNGAVTAIATVAIGAFTWVLARVTGRQVHWDAMNSLPPTAPNLRFANPTWQRLNARLMIRSG
jgi:hypothetical protein